MVATLGPAKLRVAIDDTIGPRTPMHSPNTPTNRASSSAEGHADMTASSATPAAVPAKLTLTVLRYPKRSAARPLVETETTESMPTMPNAVAAVIGENPKSMK